MFNFNPDVMRIDDGEPAGRIVSTERTDTSKITDAEMKAASIAAARELAAVPYAELPIEVKKAMSATEKREYVTAQREEEIRLRREEAAAADPLRDPTQRPDAQVKGDNEYIMYYSWVGGYETGNWRLTRVPRTEENLNTYGGRQVGGPTRVEETGKVSDANTLIIQPRPKRDNDGMIIGWEVDGTDAIDLIGTDGRIDGTVGTTDGTPSGTPDGTGRTVVSRVEYGDTVVVTYSDGTKTTFAKTSTAGTSGTTGTRGATGTTGTTGTKSLTQADVDAAVAKAVTAATAQTNALVAEQKAQAAAAAFATKTKASDRLKAMFDAVGLGSLAGFINKRIMEDASEEAVLLELYEQPEYQLRFPGMKALRSKGKTITEAEYIKDEKAFAQTARFFDIPVGFYDTPDDFGKLIGNLVSPKEYQDRLQVGQDLARSMSPGTRLQLQELYNIGEGGITAYVLDSDRALGLLQKQAKSAQFIGFGREKGFKLEGMTAAQAEQIVGTEAYSKLSAQQMQTALGQAAQLRQTQSRLTGIEGEVYNEGEALKAVIEGSPEAILASQQRAQREGARFGGGSGVTGSSLRSTTMI
jgi:hypothetical protein